MNKERKRNYKPETLLKWQFQKQWKKTPIRDIEKEITLLRMIADDVTIRVAEEVLQWKKENLKSWLRVSSSFKGETYNCNVMK